MRGILGRYVAVACSRRSTPAHAGNTDRRWHVRRCAVPIHPRTCGEYHNDTVAGVDVEDPPPHMRGIPLATRDIVTHLCTSYQHQPTPERALPAHPTAKPTAELLTVHDPQRPDQLDSHNGEAPAWLSNLQRA